GARAGRRARGGGPGAGGGAPASRAERERSDARRVRSGKIGSNRSPDDYLALAERLERFLAELPG
ncbi:SMI1/KNR4 family protein, partial [Pseudomonas aeruginosa]|nr:SMI1/KNR4 family protein [Pseudomonas aeruginosa]